MLLEFTHIIHSGLKPLSVLRRLDKVEIYNENKNDPLKKLQHPSCKWTVLKVYVSASHFSKMKTKVILSRNLATFSWKPTTLLGNRTILPASRTVSVKTMRFVYFVASQKLCSQKILRFPLEIIRCSLEIAPFFLQVVRFL